MDSSQEEKGFVLVSPEQSIAVRDTALLNVFQTDEDIHGHDMLAMTDLFENCLGLLRDHQSKYERSEDDLNMTPELLSGLTNYLKGFYDLKNSYLLVGDVNSLSAEIKAKIREGSYHIAESKKIGGNYRAAVVDADNQIKAQITLRGVQNTGALLSDINTLAMQAALKQITDQLRCLERDVEYLIQLTRREYLQSPFFNAREKLRDAARTQDSLKVKELVEVANTYLMEGLNSLYGDFTDNMKTLVNLTNKRGSKIEDIEKTLQYLNEDVQLIPQYVGLRTYLFGYLNDSCRAEEVLDEYRYKMNEFVTVKMGKKGLTGAQYLHKFFPYTEENMDFWITKLPDINQQLRNVELTKSLDGKEVVYISAEEA